MPSKVLHDFEAMGSPCKLVFYSVDHLSDSDVIELATTEIKRLETKYSRYRDDSVASDINRSSRLSNQVQRRINLDQETCYLLNYADVAYQLSNGLFDISSGVFRRVWDFKSGLLPTKSQLGEIKQQVGWEKIHWQAPELHFPYAGMEIDFGGYVKEYAVDKVCGILKQNQIKHAYIDLGGDIAIVGPQADGSAWNIGVRDPANPELPIATIELSRGAIASSGDYERFMEIDGKRYSHIINPKTGWPVDYWACVSVVAEQCIIAGTAATVTMLKEQAGKNWLQELGLRAIAVTKNGQIFNNITEPPTNLSTESAHTEETLS